MPRHSQLSQPCKKISLLVFKIAAHRGELQMRVQVNETGKDDRLAERFNLEIRKLRDDLGAWTNAGDALSRDGDSTVLDRCRQHGNDPTRRIDSRHLAGAVS